MILRKNNTEGIGAEKNIQKLARSDPFQEMRSNMSSSKMQMEGEAGVFQFGDMSGYLWNTIFWGGGWTSIYSEVYIWVWLVTSCDCDSQVGNISIETAVMGQPKTWSMN